MVGKSSERFATDRIFMDRIVGPHPAGNESADYLNFVKLPSPFSRGSAASGQNKNFAYR